MTIWQRFRDIATYTLYSVHDWLSPWEVLHFRKYSWNYKLRALSDSHLIIS